jgi:ubiquitin-protein ligase
MKYRDDLVADTADVDRIGLVIRGALDDEDSDADSDNGWRRNDGANKVRVAFFNDRLSQRSPYQMLPESRLVLLDRAFMVGDIAKYPLHSGKMAFDEPAEMNEEGIVTEATTEVIRVEGFVGNAIQEQSGTIVKLNMKATLEHVMTGRKVEDVDTRELAYIHELEEGDNVVLDNWFGVVKEVFDEVTVAFEDGSVCVVNEPPDLTPVERYHPDSVFASTRLYPGLTVRAEPQVWTEAGHWIQGSYKQNVHKVGVVVDVKPYTATVAWTVYNTLAPVDLDNEPEPPSQCITDIASLRVLRSSQEHSTFQVGDKVQLRDAKRGLDLLGYSSSEDSRVNQCLVIRETSTAVDVLWQDSSLSKGVSTCKLIPCHNIDDQEVWPMDYIVYKRQAQAMEPSPFAKVGMVMAASAADRTSVVTWLTEDMMTLGEREDVSVYEVRPHPEWEFRLGHSVLVVESGELNLDRDKEWVGEIVDIAFTGRIKVAFPLSGKQVDLFPYQLLLLENGNQVDETSEEDSLRGRRGLGLSLGSEEADEPNPLTESRVRGRRRDRQWLNDVEGLVGGESPTTWEPDDSFDRPVQSAWEDTDIIEFESSSPYGNFREGEYLRVQVVGGDEEEDLDDEEAASGLPGEQAEAPFTGLSSPAIPPGSLFSPGGSPPKKGQRSGTPGSPPRDDGQAASDSELDQDVFLRVRPYSERVDHESDVSSQGSRHWDVESETSSLSESSGVLAIGRFFTRFSIVDSSPPANHKFLNRPGPPQQSKNFAKRIKRECDMMASNLPDGILVRTFESRLDLLRALIVGPPHTPYEAALFLFDLYLPPEYPADPPQVHFHSWTGGMGRLNPNLYEEGKVCISLLGTWHGKEDTETWSLSSSSILQVLLSIQGLVLGVEQPYFNEAGYERLMGNQEDIRNAAMYSERAFLLSIRSILHALEELPEPFEKETQGFFGEPMRNLERIIGRCEVIVRRTEEEGPGTVVLLHEGDSVGGSDAGWSAVEDRRIEGGIIRTVSKGCLKLLKVRPLFCF